jgi:glutathione S-transferase
MSKYTLYYWPVPFRGNFIKCLFAFSGVPYEEASVADILKIKNAPPASQALAPGMAPPCLVDHDAGIQLAQMPAIMSYLSHKCGLMPDALDKQALALKAVLDANDLLCEISLNNGAQMWNADSWAAFSGKRLVRWLEINEQTAVLHGLTSDAGYMLGTSAATMADISVFALLNTMERCLPELSPTLRKNAPRVMALCDRLLAENEALSAFIATQQSNVYCGGFIEKSIKAMLKGEDGPQYPLPEA